MRITPSRPFPGGGSCACREPTRPYIPRVSAAREVSEPGQINFGRPYGGSPAFILPDGRGVTMWRKHQRVRFYDDAGNQVGPEQPNVAPAMAFALSQGWRNADPRMAWLQRLAHRSGDPTVPVAPHGRPRTRELAERVASRGTEPIVLVGSLGSKCRPFLTVHKDDEKFAACNALADEIGPLNDPKKVFRLLEEAIGDELSEVFGVMTLDLHGRLKGMTNTGMGEASSVMAPMIPTLRAALLSGGGGAILYHVHPSGIEAEPSQADKDTTEAFDEAFENIGMPLIDHVIVAGSARKRSFFSFREAGLL